MRTLLAVWAALSFAGPAGAAIAYSRFAHPRGDYVLEYPADWKRSFGMQTVWLTPPGRAAADVRISLELYPLGKNSPATPEEFVSGLLEQVGVIKALVSRETVKAAGAKAERLALRDTLAQKDAYGQTIPPMDEVYLVVPLKGGDGHYYVLRLQGMGEAVKAAMPEFEEIARKLQVRPPNLPQRKYR